MASRLTEKKVRSLLQLRSSGLSYKELGKRFGISAEYVGKIVRGERWDLQGERRQPSQLSVRERDALKKRAQSLQRRLVVIPDYTDAELKERFRREADDELWIRSYWQAFSRDPYYPLEPQQLQMAADFAALLSQGGDRATAASRGEGKTTLAVALTVKAILQGGGQDLWVLLGATARNARNILHRIRKAMLNDELGRYYKEACCPVRALQHTPQRAKTQVANGRRFPNGERFEYAETCFHWTGDHLVFPNVPGSPSAGAIVTSDGLDTAVRGCNIDNMRPRAVIIDDPDNPDSIRNPSQADKLLRAIDRDVAGLGSQRRPVSRLVLCTCASRVSAAAQLTDPAKYPSFRGRRMRFLLEPPSNKAAWEKFVNLCKQGWTGETGDVRESPIPRAAHEFYVAHRVEMDAGAAVANPNRFDHRIRPEGGTVEISALEHYYGWVARIGQANTSTEFDNDPPDDLGLLDLTVEQIRDSRSGWPYRVVPPDTARITVGADVKKLGLHWVAVAWDERCVGSILEFHFWRFATAGQRPEACEHAVLEGLREWWDWIQSHKPWREDPEDETTARFPDWTLIDSGWKDEGWSIQPVSVFASEVGFGRCMPCKGFGRYRRPQPQRGIRIFDECHIDYRNRTPLCDVNADAYKTRVHEGFMADFNTPGSLGLHDPRAGDDGRQLRSSLEEEREYGSHIISEQWDPARAKFLPPNGPNHYLDATALARVGAALGRLSSIPAEPPRSRPRQTLAQMAAAAKR